MVSKAHKIHRTIATVISALALISATSCKKRDPHPPGPRTEIRPLNVVFITIDTLRADHLHCYGNANIQTPVIDGLANSGVLFEKAVTPTPLTLPSHASMFTGTNPNVNQVRDTGGFALRPSSVTLATLLRDRGWNTGAFVSAFVLNRLFGFNQGFVTYDDRMPDNQRGRSVAARPAGVTIDHAIEWLNHQPDKPFLVWIHLFDPHRPYDPPAEFRSRYPGDPYDAEIAYADQQLGRFLSAVKRKAPAGNTLFVLLADHGESLGDHGEYEHGVFLYDSTVRVAWIMSGPGVPAGVRIRQQARTIDVLPTILNLLGEKAPAGVQGVSMVPAFTGKNVAARYSYEETLYPKINFGWAELRGIHSANWMYVRAPQPELYDLSSDPRELHNIIGQNPAKYRQLDAELRILARTDSSGHETVTTNQMNQQTMEQLQSLGYAGGSTDQRQVELNGTGADPKSRVNILKIIHVATSRSKPLPASRRITLLRDGIEQDPTNPALYYDLSDLYRDRDQVDDALKVCLVGESHGIRDGMMMSRLGELYLRKGDLNRAIQYLARASQLNPLDVQGESNLATAYLQDGRLSDAERSFRWVLTLQDFVPAYNGLGIIAMQRGDLPAAKRNFARAVQLDPTYVEAQLNLGIACTRSDDFPCARKAFRAFLAEAPAGSYSDMIPRVQYALRRMQQPGS